MYIQTFWRVELDPETEDDLIDKYTSDDRWNLIYNSPEKMVFEEEPLRYQSEPKYYPGILN